MRTIGVVTVGRSDYGIYLPILKKIAADKELKLHLIVAGMHLLPQYGNTIDEIKRDGFEIGDVVELTLSHDSPAAIAKAMGRAVVAFAQSYEKIRPDILLVLGDRFEMHAAVLAALPFKIPLAHIHGGELTQGAIDDALRHGITKIAHLHFATTAIYKKRIEQLGEESWRITVCGAPALDGIPPKEFLSLEALTKKFVLPCKEPPLLVTYHPVTLEFEQSAFQIAQLLEALKESDCPIVFTAPNADTSNQIIRKEIENFVRKNPKAKLVLNFGPKYYFNMMAHSLAMVGNTSSGLIEAASFALPVVNIGSRQDGRVRGKNVIDVGYKTPEIIDAIAKATSKKFRSAIQSMKNPYSAGGASEKIVRILKETPLNEKLIKKTFIDL